MNKLRNVQTQKQSPQTLHIPPQHSSSSAQQPAPNKHSQTPRPRTPTPRSPPADIQARHVAWLSGSSGTSFLNNLCRDMKKPSPPAQAQPPPPPPPAALGILAFEAARTMSRLVSLYRSVSDAEIRRLRTGILTSRGVTYLNSADERRLLFLACAEHLAELNASAEAVARLSQKCSDPCLVRFDLVYADLKLGLIDPRKKLDFGSKNVLRIISKMEKLAIATAELHMATESLAELELSERKIVTKWKTVDPKKFGKANFQALHQEIGHLRKQIHCMRDSSLWNVTYDKSVGLMARIVCVVYARICVVFGPHISELTAAKSMQSDQYYSCRLEDRKFHQRNRKWASKSEPKPRRREIAAAMSSYNSISLGFDKMTGCEIGLNHSKVSRLAGPSTVGGSAMTARYASVILLAERCLSVPGTVSDDTRRELYEMLPESLRRRVGAKLRECPAREEAEAGAGDGRALASGWREALEDMMAWLAPMAHDTVAWQAARNVERQSCSFDGGRSRERPPVLLVQTLHFSDLEKAEAAIVEVLVGLSLVFSYENIGQRFPNNHRLYQPVVRTVYW